MPRVKRGVVARRRRKKVIKRAKGYYSQHRKNIRSATETVQRALAYSYRDRKNRKREFRRLWIVRINAAARLNGISYAKLMGALGKADVQLDRKVLADIAVRDPEAFSAIVQKVS